MSIADFLSEHKITFETNVSLSTKSWIKTGGICAYWVSPNSVGQLVELCRFLYKNNIQFDLVGQTSNIFFHSTYHPRVVVSTVKVNSYSMNDNVVTCDCGVSVMRLSKEFLAEGYAGFYGLVGLPGTVASAAVNNAGCFGCSISSMLISANVLMPDGNVHTMNKEDFGYEHKSSKFVRGETKGVVLSVKLKLQKADNIEEEYKKSEETKQHRKTKQECAAKNLGSVFSALTIRPNWKNRIAAFITKMLGKVGFVDVKRIYKKLLLCLYHYRDLDRYISDRHLITFIWRDENAEKMFISCSLSVWFRCYCEE